MVQMRESDSLCQGLDESDPEEFLYKVFFMFALFTS